LHYLTHGPALGLWVSDALAQTARAEALLAQVHRQPVGAGELAIPSIRGVDGSPVYFLDHGDTLSFFSFGK
jgi:4-hydroxyphenylpyruvate dioxygenase-like putative hemolysin